jgi:hypothetical protein
MKRKTLGDLILILPTGQPLLFKKDQKKHYSPIPSDKQPDIATSIDELAEQFPDAKIRELEFHRKNSKQKKRPENIRHLRITDAIYALSHIDDLFKDGHDAVVAFLVFFMSRMMDVTHSLLSGTPLVHLEGTSLMPEMLKHINQITFGATVVEGKDWRVQRPFYLESFTPLGRFAPSTDVGAYVGGRWKRTHFWVPYHNCSVIMAPNLPPTVQKTIVSHSPLMIPVLLGKGRSNDSRPIVTLSGASFEHYNAELLEHFKEQLPLMNALINQFLLWLRRKDKRMRHWKEDISSFYPTHQDGQYTHVLRSHETTIYAAALALWKHFLLYASEKEAWISHDIARDLLSRYWELVLPNSSPTSPKAASVQGRAWDMPELFWEFLVKYSGENKEKISDFNEVRNSATVACLHKLPQGPHIIFPREQVFDAYLSWLNIAQIPAPTYGGTRETSMLHSLLNNGISVKTEGNDITYRFGFYAGTKASSSNKGKCPCLAFPIASIPSEVLSALEGAIGKSLGVLTSSATTRTALELENV